MASGEEKKKGKGREVGREANVKMIIGNNCWNGVLTNVFRLYRVVGGHWAREQGGFSLTTLTNILYFQKMNKKHISLISGYSSKSERQRSEGIFGINIKINSKRKSQQHDQCRLV